MVNLLLAIIYLSFISLGLPDALLGAAWPTMCMEWNVPVSYAGIISIIISAGTIISSLLSDRMTRWLERSLLLPAAASILRMFWMIPRIIWVSCGSALTDKMRSCYGATPAVANAHRNFLRI